MTHPKRPRDPNQLARLIVGIATGEEDDCPARQAVHGRCNQRQGRMKRYRFCETPLATGEVRLEWLCIGQRKDPLDFWIVPRGYVEQAKERVRAGEFD